MSFEWKNQPEPKPGTEPVSRRKFLSYLIGGISGAIAVAVASPLIGYFLSPIWKKSTPLLTSIARTTDIPAGQPTFVTYEQRMRDGWYITTRSKGAWIVNRDKEEFIVFDPRCTHLNCPYYWDEDKQIFKCPCHDGEFDIEGNVLQGPPPRPLDRLEITIEGGNILASGQITKERKQ
ncbi:MAG: ubiquinol-cytochrome c reductase iron-sulfur subunit [Chloroflexi bacterium]|nr:ubiquinol-cytochrome c reductase iron-sulfur subunit [Chloroflexota bacterium]